MENPTDSKLMYFIAFIIKNLKIVINEIIINIFHSIYSYIIKNQQEYEDNENINDEKIQIIKFNSSIVQKTIDNMLTIAKQQIELKKIYIQETKMIYRIKIKKNFQFHQRKEK